MNASAVGASLAQNRGSLASQVLRTTQALRKTMEVLRDGPRGGRKTCAKPWKSCAMGPAASASLTQNRGSLASQVLRATQALRESVEVLRLKSCGPRKPYAKRLKACVRYLLPTSVSTPAQKLAQQGQAVVSGEGCDVGLGDAAYLRERLDGALEGRHDLAGFEGHAFARR